MSNDQADAFGKTGIESPCNRCTQNGIHCEYDETVKRSRSACKKKPADCCHEEEGIDSRKRIPENKFRIGDLRHLSFCNDLYEPIRIQQQKNERNSNSNSSNNNNNLRGYLQSTSLPPLLFDFFNLSAQPYSIWTNFHKLFQQYLHVPSPTSHASELANEVLALFTTYNCLYNVFIDIDSLLRTLNRFPNLFCVLHDQQAQPTEAEPSYVLLLSVFALVFQAAYQSLSVSNHLDIIQSLHQHAYQFYREAHRHFIALTFPKEPSAEIDMTQIVQASILLTHFQCVTVCPKQALVTLRMGAAIAEQCQTDGQTATPSWILMQKILHGWNTWFSLHLWTEYFDDEAELGNSNRTSRGCLEEGLRFDPNPQVGPDNNQQWAICVLDQYMHFFKDLLRRPYDDHVLASDIKHRLELIEKLCIPLCDGSVTNIPTAVLALYHHVLTIQLFRHQQHDRQTELPIPKSADKQTQQVKGEDLLHDSSSSSPKQQELQLSSSSISPNEVCTTAAQQIIQIVKSLTDGCGVINARGQQQGVMPSAIFYPLCAATTIFLWRLRSFHETVQTYPKAKICKTEESQNHNSDDIQQKDITIMSEFMPEWMSCIQLHNLLKVVQNQMDAAEIVLIRLNQVLYYTMELNKLSNKLVGWHEADQAPISSISTATTASSTSSSSSSFSEGLEDGMLPQQNRTLSQMVPFQVTNFMLRRDIDREQLEKLSVNSKDLRDNNRRTTATMMVSYQQPNLMTINATETTNHAINRRSRGVNTHGIPSSHLQKQHPSVPIDLQQQSMMMMQSEEVPLSKRLRTDSWLSEGGAAGATIHDKYRSYSSPLNFFRSSSERPRNAGYLDEPEFSGDPLDLCPEDYLLVDLRVPDQMPPATDGSQCFYKDRSMTLLERTVSSHSMTGLSNTGAAAATANHFSAQCYSSSSSSQSSSLSCGSSRTHGSSPPTSTSHSTKQHGNPTSNSNSHYHANSTTSSSSSNSNSHPSCTSTSHHGRNLAMSTIANKLPLPPPKQSTLPTKKQWATGPCRDWNQCFTESILETLHLNTSSTHLEPPYTGMDVAPETHSTLDPAAVLVNPTPPTDPVSMAENSILYTSCMTAPPTTTWMASKTHTKKRSRTPPEAAVTAAAAWTNTQISPTLYPTSNTTGTPTTATAAATTTTTSSSLVTRFTGHEEGEAEAEVEQVEEEEDGKPLFPPEDNWMNLSQTAKMSNDIFTWSS